VDCWGKGVDEPCALGWGRLLRGTRTQVWGQQLRGPILNKGHLRDAAVTVEHRKTFRGEGGE